DEDNVMPLFPAPHTDDLRHNAGKIGIHDARIQSSRGAPGNEIYDPDLEFSHAQTNSPGPVGTPSESSLRLHSVDKWAGEFSQKTTDRNAAPTAHNRKFTHYLPAGRVRRNLHAMCAGFELMAQT